MRAVALKSPRPKTASASCAVKFLTERPTAHWRWALFEALFQRAQEQSYFIGAVNTLAQGRMVPVPGGVLIEDDGVLLGAIGVSGDSSDNDEICAVAGIQAAGLQASTG